MHVLWLVLEMINTKDEWHLKLKLVSCPGVGQGHSLLDVSRISHNIISESKFEFHRCLSSWNDIMRDCC